VIKKSACILIGLLSCLCAESYGNLGYAQNGTQTIINSQESLQQCPSLLGELVEDWPEFYFWFARSTPIVNCGNHILIKPKNLKPLIIPVPFYRLVGHLKEYDVKKNKVNKEFNLSDKALKEILVFLYKRNLLSLEGIVVILKEIIAQKPYGFKESLKWIQYFSNHSIVYFLKYDLSELERRTLVEGYTTIQNLKNLFFETFEEENSLLNRRFNKLFLVFIKAGILPDLRISNKQSPTHYDQYLGKTLSLDAIVKLLLCEGNKFKLIFKDFSDGDVRDFIIFIKKNIELKKEDFEKIIHFAQLYLTPHQIGGLKKALKKLNSSL